MFLRKNYFEKDKLLMGRKICRYHHDFFNFSFFHQNFSVTVDKNWDIH
jgi:hypothetical protein